MKVYIVLKSTSAITGYTTSAFTSLTKALNYMEADANGKINTIKEAHNGEWWKASWYHKEYCSSSEWAELLLNHKNIENKRWIANGKCYGIEVIEVK